MSPIFQNTFEVQKAEVNDACVLTHRILANAYGCAPFGGGRAPNFVLLDFVNIGEGIRAADLLNGFA